MASDQVPVASRPFCWASTPFFLCSQTIFGVFETPLLRFDQLLTVSRPCRRVLTDFLAVSNRFLVVLRHFSWVWTLFLGGFKPLRWFQTVLGGFRPIPGDLETLPLGLDQFSAGFKPPFWSFQTIFDGLKPFFFFLMLLRPFH